MTAKSMPLEHWHLEEYGGPQGVWMASMTTKEQAAADHTHNNRGHRRKNQLPVGISEWTRAGGPTTAVHKCLKQEECQTQAIENLNAIRTTIIIITIPGDGTLWQMTCLKKQKRSLGG